VNFLNWTWDNLLLGAAGIVGWEMGKWLIRHVRITWVKGDK
jgi:hypothetical protein